MARKQGIRAWLDAFRTDATTPQRGAALVGLLAVAAAVVVLLLPVTALTPTLQTVQCPSGVIAATAGDPGTERWDYDAGCRSAGGRAVLVAAGIAALGLAISGGAVYILGPPVRAEPARRTAPPGS